MYVGYGDARSSYEARCEERQKIPHDGEAASKLDMGRHGRGHPVFMARSSLGRKAREEACAAQSRQWSPTWVWFKVVEYNADMWGPPVSETKWREYGALLGREEKDGADSWFLGGPKGRKGINKIFFSIFLNIFSNPISIEIQILLKFDQTQAS